MRDAMKLAAVLAALTVAVFATEWLAFMWPVMALVDAGAAMTWHKRRHATTR
jgi:hypothetical protein